MKSEIDEIDRAILDCLRGDAMGHFLKSYLEDEQMIHYNKI